MNKDHKIILGVIAGGLAVWGIIAYANSKKTKQAVDDMKTASLASAAMGQTPAVTTTSTPGYFPAGAGMQEQVSWDKNFMI
jgi:hypothetical protein